MITVFIKRTAFILLRANSCISNMYILDHYPRLLYQTIGVTYPDYVYPILISGDFPITSKTGECWNLLESSPSIIPLIGLSHKWTQILFIISNLQIWNLALYLSNNRRKLRIQCI